MKKILAIDGGGVRGLIPALILAEIERATGQQTARLFDLVVGVSTGGILALGLTRPGDDGEPLHGARAMAEVYAEYVGDIFAGSRMKTILSLGGYRDELYPSDGLERALTEFFGDDPLGAALTHTMVASYDIQNREPYFFKSWRRQNRTVEMRQVARATSAAPTYFEPALVPVGGSTRALVDGGVFLNNPAMSAYAEAVRLFPDEEEFLLVSLGTGELVRPIAYERAKDWGKLDWAQPILDVVIDGVGDAVDYQLRHILPGRYIRFQTGLTDAANRMDDASPANLALLAREADKILTTHREQLRILYEAVAADTPTGPDQGEIALA